MTAKFEVSAGPLNCTRPRGVNKRIDETCLDKFWSDVGSADRRGVYVFGIHAGPGWKPLYVGETIKQTFRKRMDQHIKYEKYKNFNQMLQGIKKGTPWLFLIGRIGQGKIGKAAIEALELEYINHAYARNDDLYNDRKIRTPPYSVGGFGGKGKKTSVVKNLAKMIGHPDAINWTK